MSFCSTGAMHFGLPTRSAARAHPLNRSSTSPGETRTRRLLPCVELRGYVYNLFAWTNLLCDRMTRVCVNRSSPTPPPGGILVVGCVSPADPTVTTGVQLFFVIQWLTTLFDISISFYLLIVPLSLSTQSERLELCRNMRARGESRQMNTPPCRRRDGPWGSPWRLESMATF